MKTTNRPLTTLLTAGLGLGLAACASGGRVSEPTDIWQDDVTASEAASEAREDLAQRRGASRTISKRLEGLRAVTIHPVDATRAGAEPVPEAMLGARIEGTANVLEVVSERGFWVGDEGVRVFVVAHADMPKASRMDLEIGQRVYIDGTIMTVKTRQALDGEVTEEAEAVMEDVDMFIALDAPVQILEASGRTAMR